MRSLTKTLIGLALLLAIVLVGSILLWKVLVSRAPNAVVIPPAEQCAATVEGVQYSLTLEQSGNAAIIVGETLRRGLPARAATIALVTALQESSLRNLDHGDADSVGLFQQRPSQGWGTASEIMDPWYATGKFLDAMVKISGWQTMDVNDVAQQVQRSGVPDGYRKHESTAKAWASALSGNSPASVSCVDRGSGAGTVSPIATLLTKVFGSHLTVKSSASTVTLASSNSSTLWAASQLAMMTTGDSGITRVTVGQQRWAMDANSVADWSGSAAPSPTSASISVRTS